MEIKTCKSCGKLFNCLGTRKVCQECFDKEEETFTKVKKCLDENSGMSLEMISEEMDVSVRLLQRWVREERLCFSEARSSGIVCEKCGKPIGGGRYCPNCKTAMLKTIKGVMDDKEQYQKSDNRMRFDRNKNN